MREPAKLVSCVHSWMFKCSFGCASFVAWLPKLILMKLPNPIRTSGTKYHKQYVCPCCGSRRGLSLMGLRSATKISASISQMFASRFNDDKKTLAFSDNVQDAAHRAGFFNSRTWRFGLRTAIQKICLSADQDTGRRRTSERYFYCWGFASANLSKLSYAISVWN